MIPSNKKLKIGFFTDNYLPAVDGVALSLSHFKKSLEDKGHEVFVFTASYKSSRSKKIFSDFDYTQEKNVIRFPSIPSVWFEGYQDTLPYRKKDIRMVESFDLDIVHIHTVGQIGMLGVYISQKHNLPLIATYHTHYIKYALEKKYTNILPGSIVLSLILPIVAKDKSMYSVVLPGIRPSGSLNTWHNSIATNMVNILHQICDVVIVPSEKVKKDLLLTDKKSHFIVLPTGVNTEEINDEHINVQHQFNKNSTILYVGRISIEKNIALLLHMFTRLGKYNKQTKLVLIGPDMGGHTKEMMNLASSLGIADRILFLGSMNRASVLMAMKKADVFVFPSVTETQGLVLGEAAMMGLPIVYCDDGISNLAKNNFNALLAKNNALDFAKKTKKLLSSPELRFAMSKNGLSLIADNTADIMSDRIIAIYYSILKN